MTNKKFKTVLARNMRKMLGLNWDASLKAANFYLSHNDCEFLEYLKQLNCLIVDIAYLYNGEIDMANTIIYGYNLFCSLFELVHYCGQDRHLDERRVYQVIYYRGAYEDYGEIYILTTHSLDKAISKRNEKLKEINDRLKQYYKCKKCKLCYDWRDDDGNYIDNITNDIVESNKCNLYTPRDDKYCQYRIYNKYDIGTEGVRIEAIEIED